MTNIYFSGYKASNKAYLGINILETNKQIEAVINRGTKYIGGYKGTDGEVILENVIFSVGDIDITNDIFKSLSKGEESIYKCEVSNRVKIGSFRDIKYLIATIYDLMCSLNGPMQGFTVQLDGEDVFLLMCIKGEYIMNPYYKGNQDAIK